MKSRGKILRVLIPAVALVLAAAIGLTAWYSAGHSSSGPVNVYSFYDLGITNYWGDTQESDGRVEADKVQTVYLSTTQTVTEVLVSLGDTVAKGDVLMTFDTTLSDLALERKRLEVEKLKLQLSDAQSQLAEINSMRPMVIPVADSSDDTDENLGTALTTSYQLSTQAEYDGSAKDKALICWLNSSAVINDALLDAVRQQAEALQIQNAKAEAMENASSASPTDPTGSTDSTGTTDPTNSTNPTGATDPTGSTDATDATDPTDPAEPTPEPTDPTEPDVTVTVSSFYVVFKVTEGNMSLGSRTVWQGVFAIYNADTGAYGLQFFDASIVPDHTLAPDEEEPDTPTIDYGSGYTAAQIAQMRSDQEKTIQDLEFNIKMAEADYQIMQTEVTDGKIYAQVDGVVTSLISEDEAKLTQEPMLKISGGGGFYVQGTISELQKEEVEIGQEVTITDWYTGMTYAGTVEALGDYPSSEGYWSGLGNPNTSYYPFTVFVDETADLQSGRYVSIGFSAAEGNGIYLQNPFIRTENGQSYVYVQGEDGTLEKRIVTTGKNLWGSYTEIVSGLTAEDYIAFPYGKNLRQGAEAVQADISELYG